MRDISYKRHFFKLRYAVFIFYCLICLIVQTQLSYAQGLRIIRDQEIENVLREIATPVFEQAGFSSHDINIILIKSYGLNAFVAGGKNIFINTGLMLETTDPSEILGVLAHETSHIASGHLIRTQKVVEGLSLQTLITTIAGMAAAILAGNSGAGAAIMKGGQAVGISGFLKHSRIQESAADNGAVAYLKAAHLSSRGLLSFMEKLQGEELLPASQQSKYIRTHPLTRDRINFLKYSTDNSKYADKPIPEKWQKNYARAKAKLLGFILPERALRLKDKTSIPANYSRSVALYRLGRIEESLQLLQGLLKQEPNNPYFYELKGQILFENAKVKPAVEAYSKAVGILPEASLIQIDYAHTLIEYADKVEKKQRNNLLQRAIDALEKAKKHEGHNSRLFKFLGMAYGARGQEGYARLSLAEEALLQNRIEDAERQLSYAITNLPKKAVQAKLRVQDLLQLIENRKNKMNSESKKHKKH